MTIDDKNIEKTLRQWHQKAIANVEKWGLQSIPVLALCTQEELSELGDEMDSEGNVDLEVMLDMMVDTGLTLQVEHERLFEDDDGNPVENPPSLELTDDADLDRIEDELKDTAALLIQIQAAIDRAREKQ